MRDAWVSITPGKGGFTPSLRSALASGSLHHFPTLGDAVLTKYAAFKNFVMTECPLEEIGALRGIRATPLFSVRSYP